MPSVFNAASNLHKPKSLDLAQSTFAGDTPATTGTNYFFLWPSISPRSVR